MKTITTVGVVGAGTMGSALAQKFAQEGFRTVLLDREMQYVERGMNAVRATLRAGIERRLFTAEHAEAIQRRILGTERWNDLAPCDLVVEAIFEDKKAKNDLLSRLSALLAPDAIIATNTSSFSVTELAQSVSHPERFCGLHYFYHAAKNRLVEIIPGERTSAATLRAAERFAFMTGKDPIYCRDRYGFAVNRFFVPWLNEAARLLQERAASVDEIDAVCMNVFGIGMGPFTLMNATGVPIAYHAQRTLETLGTFYAVADALKDQALGGTPWKTGGAAAAPPETEHAVRERMLGAVFLACGQILDERVCSPVELNRGARIGLKWRRGPVEMMRALGKPEVERLVRLAAARYQTPFPHGMAQAFAPMEFVGLRRAGSNAIITIERPEDMNALNEPVVAQLEARFAEAEGDAQCETIVITGVGKAFVAGADIGFFVEHQRAGTIERIVEFTRTAQALFDRIDRSPKRVLALLNGLALGGGLELALCADGIYALPGARMAFPETGIGIYPGLGGTQRTQARIGKGLTKYLIFTGEMITAAAAESMGLSDGTLTHEAYFSILEGAPAGAIARSRSARAPQDERWRSIGAAFDACSLDAFLDGSRCLEGISAEDAERMRARVRQKAPLALRAAERLVNESRGCASELELLPEIFRTGDAMLGLGSIGKKVQFTGN